MRGFPGMEPGAGSAEEEEVSRTGTMSKEEAEWLLRVLPVLEADSLLKDIVSSSLVDWASRTTWKTHVITKRDDLDMCTFVLRQQCQIPQEQIKWKVFGDFTSIKTRQNCHN